MQQATSQGTPPFGSDSAAWTRLQHELQQQLRHELQDHEDPPAPQRSREWRLSLVCLACIGAIAVGVVAASVYGAVDVSRRLQARGDAAALRALAVNPQDGRLLSLASDEAAAPESRLAALQAMVEGVCLRHQELLFGVATDRYLAFEAVAGAVERVPLGLERAAAARRLIQEYDTDPWRLPRMEGATGPMGRIMLRRVRERAEYCSRLAG